MFSSDHDLISGYLDWHSTECVTPKIQAILDCWIGVALHRLECRVEAKVECHIALHGTALQALACQSGLQLFHSTLQGSTVVF